MKAAPYLLILRKSDVLGKQQKARRDLLPNSRSRLALQWQGRKKLRGKIHYFERRAKRVDGKLVRIDDDGWKEAMGEYNKVADDLPAGRTSRVRKLQRLGGLNIAFDTGRSGQQCAAA